VLSLVIFVSAFLVLSCGQAESDRNTNRIIDRHTDAANRYTHATTVVVIIYLKAKRINYNNHNTVYTCCC